MEPIRFPGRFHVGLRKEMTMKTRILTILAAAALLTAASTATYAQNSGPDQEKGSTGWSGGAKDQPGQQQQGNSSTTGQAVVHDEGKAKDQPVTATGEDLKGLPKQFAPSKTPE
jgi:hypothetical protein